MARAIRSEAELAQILARPGFRVASQIGGERVDTRSTSGSRDRTSLPLETPATPDTLTLPWPPSGQHAHGHSNNQRYLLPHVIAYRDTVATLCRGRGKAVGRYRLHVQLSPPDARTRDMDNALKSIFDSLVNAGYLISDSMTYMRELVVTTDDDRRGRAIVRAVPIE